MKVMLLAAGKGERLRPWTDMTPKCLLPVAGRPLLEHWVEKLRGAGFRELAVNLHYLPDQVTSHFGSGEKWGVRMEYSLEPELLGTAGALRKMKSYLGEAPFLVICADNLSDCDLQGICAFHCQHDALATMSVCWIEDPTSCGIVEFDETGRVLRFAEKPKKGEAFSNYINAGIYVLDPQVFRYIPESGPSDLSLDVFPPLLGQLYAYHYPGKVLKFDRPEDWEISQTILAGPEGSKFIAAGGVTAQEGSCA